MVESIERRHHFHLLGSSAPTVIAAGCEGNFFPDSCGLYFIFFLCASFRDTVPGTDLLSRDLAVRVPLAWMGLTAVFGMGTGVAPSREAPGILPPKLFFNSPIGKSSAAR